MNVYSFCNWSPFGDEICLPIFLAAASTLLAASFFLESSDARYLSACSSALPTRVKLIGELTALDSLTCLFFKVGDYSEGFSGDCLSGEAGSEGDGDGAPDGPFFYDFLVSVRFND